VKKGNINFENFPVAPLQFDILKIESKKKGKTLARGRAPGRALCFWGEWVSPRESGVGDEREKNED
jgi:hypothetical protein